MFILLVPKCLKFLFSNSTTYPLFTLAFLFNILSVELHILTIIYSKSTNEMLLI
jgi:hypothetical protein